MHRSQQQGYMLLFLIRLCSWVLQDKTDVHVGNKLVSHAEITAWENLASFYCAIIFQPLQEVVTETYHNMSFKSLDIIHARSNITIADYKKGKQKEGVNEQKALTLLCNQKT